MSKAKEKQAAQNEANQKAADKARQTIQYAMNLAKTMKKDFDGPKFAYAANLLTGRLLAHELGNETAMEIALAVEDLDAQLTQEVMSAPAETKTN